MALNMALKGRTVYIAMDIDRLNQNEGIPKLTCHYHSTNAMLKILIWACVGIGGLPNKASIDEQSICRILSSSIL
jgi:hypothetical protein